VEEEEMTVEPVAKLEERYLKAVLSWLDVSLEHAVRCWQQAGQDPFDRFRGLHRSASETAALIQLGPGMHWGSAAALGEEEERAYERLVVSAREEIAAAELAAASQGVSLRLKGLSERFGLSEFEWLALIVCLAPALDLRYERIYGFLQDDVTRIQACVDLVLTLLLPAGLSRLDYLSSFDSAAPLRKFCLLLPVGESDTPGRLRQAFRVAPAVVAWLLGAYSPGIELGDRAEYLEPGGEENARQAHAVFQMENMPQPEVLKNIQPLLSLYGPDRTQQDLAARQIAAALNRPLIHLVLEEGLALETALSALQIAVRDARMMNAMLYIQGGDLLVDREGCLLSQPFRILERLQDCALLGTTKAFIFNPNMPGNDSALMRVELKALTAGDRAELWALMLEGAEDHLPQAEMQILAGQFNLTSGQIVAAASTALSQALQEGRGLRTADLFNAARIHSGHHIDELAHKIAPRYTWQDLVLPETPISMLQELINMVKARPRVLEEWGLGHKLTASAGVAALFTGPPGTGKTLAAQIIASELSIDLYRIDLSTIVSKYIGETEKNLEHIFSEAQTSNAILFFDEADTIFGKRSEVKDAHDRYANIEVGYLLQRMEAYDGVTILATNLRANLDEAFTRRLQFIVNFPFPDDEYRQHIWEVLMPPGLPKADDLDFKLLAKRYKLAGGSIRNIIVSAAYLAATDGGRVTMEHLMHGARREFQKMGRLVQESDFAV
jgi:hypothetical protein